MPNARSRSITTESSARSRAIIQAAFGADDRNDSAGGDGFGCREQAANRSNDVKSIDRANDVVVDAATHQFAIGRVIVFTADDDNAGAGVAYGRELIKAGQDIDARLGFQEDHVGSGHGAVGFNRGGETPHLDREMDLAEPAIFTR